MCMRVCVFELVRVRVLDVYVCVCFRVRGVWVSQTGSEIEASSLYCANQRLRVSSIFEEE